MPIIDGWPMAAPRAPPVRLTAAQRHRLKRLARGHKSPHRSAPRRAARRVRVGRRLPGTYSGEASHPDGKETARSDQVRQAIMVDDPPQLPAVTGQAVTQAAGLSALIPPSTNV